MASRDPRTHLRRRSCGRTSGAHEVILSSPPNISLQATAGRCDAEPPRLSRGRSAPEVQVKKLPKSDNSLLLCARTSPMMPRGPHYARLSKYRVKKDFKRELIALAIRPTTG